MKSATRNFVRERAGDRCEYCRIPQSAIDTKLQIDHVVAQQHSDELDDAPELLALACERCNLHKGTNLSSVDPDSKKIVLLFHPRLDQWSDHFEVVEAEIIGKTATGRATTRLLQMNAKNRRSLRRWLIKLGEF